MIRKIKRLFIYTLVASFTFAGFTHTVQAAMIGTEQVLAADTAQQNHAKIASALARPEVIAQLEKLGVNKSDAQARVAALTDAEAAVLANQIDSLPAGGADALGVLVFIFVLLLITDILGFTRIFPFTRSVR